MVVTVTDLDASIAFYRDAVGLDFVERDDGGTLATMRTGDQLVRLQTTERQSPLMARRPVAGSTDMCFSSADDLAVTLARFQARGAEIVAGPVEKHGSRGPMVSVYTRDPDGSLIEVSHYPLGC